MFLHRWHETWADPAEVLWVLSRSSSCDLLFVARACPVRKEAQCIIMEQRCAMLEDKHAHLYQLQVQYWIYGALFEEMGEHDLM
jgi:hypothetical protein